MTVNQYLQDRYIGKTCKISIREEKDKKGNIKIDKGFTRINEKPFFTAWEHRVWKNEQQGVDKEFWFRDVIIEDKIINIKQVRNYWLFSTLNGHSFRFSSDTELDVS